MSRDPRTLGTRPRLQSLIFEVTQRCNHACLHCYTVWHPDAWGRPSGYPRGELDVGQTSALLSKALDESDCQHVTLTGGEPLLRPDLPAILDLLREREVGVTLISNGRLLDEGTVVDLLRRGVTTFELPLLGPRTVHDRLSGSPGALDASLAAMARIRYHGGLFVAVFVATRINIPHLHQAMELAFAFGARAMMLNRFNAGGRGRAHLKELMPSAEEMRTALAVASAASAEFQLPVACSIPLQPCLIDLAAYPNLRSGFCAVGTDRAYYTLDPLGNVRPCNHSTTILGNLFQASLAEILAPERLVPFMRSLPAFCQPCPHQGICQGGCKAAAEVCYGSLAAEEPFLHSNRDRAVRMRGNAQVEVEHETLTAS